MSEISPTLIPLGDTALLVRFSDRLDPDANLRAIGLGKSLERAHLPGVEEITSNLVSVLLRYDPRTIRYDALAGEVRLAVSKTAPDTAQKAQFHQIDVRFGGEDGPDLEEVCQSLELDADAFITAHNAEPLRVLAIGFAPGFTYCGFHQDALRLDRRQDVRPRVPAGSILFAAGQTAITATPIPTGWHVIGRTYFVNFDPSANPPVTLAPGDSVSFRALSR